MKILKSNSDPKISSSVQEFMEEDHFRKKRESGRTIKPFAFHFLSNFDGCRKLRKKSKSHNIPDSTEEYISLSIKKIPRIPVNNEISPARSNNSLGKLSKKHLSKYKAKNPHVSDQEEFVSLSSMTSSIGQISKDQSSIDPLDEMSANPYNKKGKGKRGKHRLPGSDLWPMNVRHLYEDLTKAGAVKHREETNAYVDAMDSLFELLSPNHRNPYCFTRNKTISDDYKIKEWTHEEILETFKYYMEVNEKHTYKPIAKFIFIIPFKGKSWSPMVKYHIEMQKDNGVGVDDDVKMLIDELGRMHLIDIPDHRALKNVIVNLDITFKDYKLSSLMPYMHNGSIVFAFARYIETKVNNPSFKAYYIQSDKFIKGFLADCIASQIVVPGMQNSAYYQY